MNKKNNVPQALVVPPSHSVNAACQDKQKIVCDYDIHVEVSDNQFEAFKHPLPAIQALRRLLKSPAPWDK